MKTSNSTSKLHWLITAFEPFAGRSTNNSQEVQNEIRKLAREKASDPEWKIQFHFATLPVEYDRCFEILKSEIVKLKKEGIHLCGVLALGEGAEEFKLETLGINRDDVPEIADNAGVKRTGSPIFPDLEIDATLPLKFPFDAFPRIRTSKHAGFYICNHLCSRMAREWGSDPRSHFAGFIHVPRTGSGGIFTPEICAAMIVNGFKNTF